MKLARASTCVLLYMDSEAKSDSDHEVRVGDGVTGAPLLVRVSSRLLLCPKWPPIICVRLSVRHLSCCAASARVRLL